jgi:tellurite resistance protein TerC
MMGLDAVLTTMVMGKALWLWLVFIAIVGLLMAFDLGLLHKKEREIGVRESLLLSAFYISIACLFGSWLWHEQGRDAGLAYFTGFFIEKTLSLDNVFVISLIFGYFAIPRLYQHRVLFWGIIGVIILRAIMIGVGAALVEEFSWILYLFGAFLILTGIKMAFSSDKAPNIEQNPLLKLLRRYLPVTPTLHQQRFFVRLKTVEDSAQEPGKVSKGYRLYATPLFLALLLIEAADLLFAVDSVPAIFAITTDPYIVYTSNIFAILGLRALYFALAALIHRFHYLKYALSLVLVFIGGKIFYNDLYGKMDPLISLSITMGILGAGIVVSLLLTRQKPVTPASVATGGGPTS